MWKIHHCQILLYNYFRFWTESANKSFKFQWFQNLKFLKSTIFHISHKLAEQKNSPNIYPSGIPLKCDADIHMKIAFAWEIFAKIDIGQEEEESKITPSGVYVDQNTMDFLVSTPRMKISACRSNEVHDPDWYFGTPLMHTVATWIIANNLWKVWPLKQLHRNINSALHISSTPRPPTEWSHRTINYSCW